MKNPLTFRTESSLGAVFISLLSLFFLGLIFIAIKNFNTDIDIMTGTHDNSTRINRISQTELVLIQTWIQDNKIEVPDGRGYKYLLRKYPSRPWLD